MFVLDRTLNTSHILSANKNSQSAFWEDTYTQEFDTGAESFEFSCYTHESIKEGNYVAFFYNNQYKMFQIIEVQEVHKKGRLVSECYCEIASLQLLNNYVKPFSGDMNCIQFFQHILHGTEWHIGKYSTSLENVVYTVNEKNIESVWSLIEDYKDIYGCEINVRVTYDNGHVTGQYIDIYAEGGLGSSTFKRFEYGVNVTGITKTKDLYDWCTGIILDVECDVSDTVIEERDGYGFTKGAGDVILDDNANRMYNAGRTHVIGVYQGKETEPVEACINAWKELQKRKEPKFDYKVTTALKDDEYEDIHLGDTVYVVDHSYTPPLLLEARVGKLELSFTDRTQNSCTLTNYKEIKSKLLDADYIKLTGTITDVVNAFFPITSEGIADGAIVDGKIETTYFQQITADIVSAGVGAFENLYAQGLTVINADIERLNATSGEITSLKSQLADIDTLVNGHLTSDNIQSMIITGDKFTVADGFIKNAMIDNITADKITTGSINTDNVYISSEDGSMIINGSLQQFKDKDGNVRIQIGKDAQDNFTFSLFDEDGTGVLINEKGITENAIADGLIVNDMVAENAGIAGSKLDIDSVVTEINEGTTTIKGTKVVLDDTNQTLDVAFNILNTKVDDVEEEITSNTTAINVQQGQIDSLISNTTITKENGEVVQLKDEYNSTKDTVDSHTTKIGSLETTVNTVSSKQASMELDLDGFRTEVSNTYVTKEEVNLINYNLINNGDFRNCYKGTFDMVPYWKCNQRVKVFELPYSWNDNTIAFHNVTGTLDSMRSIEQGIILEDGETYTLTFKAGWQMNVNRGIVAYIGYYDSSGTKVHTIDIPVANNEGGLNNLQTFTFTTPTGVQYANIIIKFYIGDTVNSGGSYVCAYLGEIKLEEGTKYTGWRGSKKDEGIIINGENLIKNGDFSSYALPRTIDGWRLGGDGCIWDLNGQDGYNKEGCIYFAHTSIEDIYSGFYQNIYNLKRRTEYTLTFYINWEFNVREFYTDLVFIDKSGAKLFGIDLKPSHQGIWSYTFVTPDIDFGHMNVGFCHRGIKEDTGGGFLGIAGNVKLTETEKVAIDDLGPQLSEYTTKTEFQQTNEDFIFKIQQSGGGNLLKNTKWKNGAYGWQHQCWDTSGTTGRYTDILAPSTTIDWRHGRDNILQFMAVMKSAGSYIRCTLRAQQWVPVEPNATYSMSFYYRQHRCVDNYWEIQGMTANGSTRTIYEFDFEDQPEGYVYGRDYSSWYWANKSFVIPSDIVSILFWVVIIKHDSSASDLSSFVWLGEPCLVKGSTPSKWQPNSDELYDGIVKIDDTGLTVQHNNNKSVLDSEALNFYAGDVRYSRVKGGRFEFTNSDGSTIGGVGKSTWVGTNTGISSLNAYYGHSVSLGAQRGVDENYTSSLTVCSKDGKLSENGGYYFGGLNISTPKVMGAMYIRGSSTDTINLVNQGMMIYADYGNGYRTGNIFANEELTLGTQYGAENWTGFVVKENGSNASKNELHAYGHLNMHNYNIGYAGWVNPVSATTTYTTRLLNEGSIENMTYGGNTFTEGELRYVHRQTCHTVEEWDYNDEGVWSPLGVYYCYCELPIFMAENIELDYHVNIGKIGWGDYRVIEKNPYLFIVESQEEGFAFTWEVVAKQVEKAKNNIVVANEYINTGAKQEMPTEDSDFTYELDKEEFIEKEEELQENINTGEE